MDSSLGELKHAHETESSYSYKEQAPRTNNEDVKTKQMIVVAPQPRGWTKVKPKKKGKKGKIEDFYEPQSHFSMLIFCFI